MEYDISLDYDACATERERGCVKSGSDTIEATHDHSTAAAGGEAALGDSGSDHEIELKFVVPEGVLKGLSARLAALEGAAKRGRAARLVSVYFDTEDHALQAAGISFRIRRRGRGRVQTIKKDAGGAGLYDRLELERPVRSEEPSLTNEESAAIAEMLGGPLYPDHTLAPIFVTTVKRTIFDVARGEAEIEIALDEGIVEAAGRSASFHELELELKAGDAAALFAVAREAAGGTPFRLGVMTKSARGYALLEGKERSSYKEQDSPIVSGMDVEAAFRAVVSDCLAQYRLNEDLLLDKPGSKAIHRARVGLRRLRSAFTLFKAVISDQRSEAIAAEVKWLAGSLGDARDLDVFRGRLPEGDEIGAEGLAARTEAHRQDAYREALGAIRSTRAPALLLDLVEWTTIGDWRSNPETAEARAAPIERLAAEILDKRLKKLRKSGHGLSHLSPEERHKARIAAKKLRYACGFFGALYDERAAKRRDAFIELMTDLQDELGALNDIATARKLTTGLAREAGAERDGDAAFSAGLLAGKAEAGIDKLLRKAEKSLDRLCAAKPFWR
ncbi:CHAD domain-containing protein [Hansschlegelia zhihuaiae]|nr:CHAD domain-containing protein [Hansschlegelia zhihuaiae]